MQWIPANTTGQSHAWVLKDHANVAELKFSLESKTMRLFGLDIRQFFLEASGRNQHRIIITSEYGILLGELQAFKLSQTGSIYLNNQKYHYTESSSGIILLDEIKQPLTECGIDGVDSLNLFEFASLVFGFVWVWQTSELKKTAVTANQFTI